MLPSQQIETLNIPDWYLSERPTASRDLAQFICKMTYLKYLTLGGQYHNKFFSTSSSMASSAKFICKMPHLKNLTLYGQYHDAFYSTSSSKTSSAKVDVPGIDDVDLRRQPSASSRMGHFVSKIPGVKHWRESRSRSHRYSATSSGACAQQSVLKDDESGNTSPTLTELTVDDRTLKGWQDCGSMFDNVKRVTIQVWHMINYDVIQRIHLPGATELTIQTDGNKFQPTGFNEEPTSLPNALLDISPQLVKVTFSDLDIGNRKVKRILQAFRSPHNLKHLKTVRFVRCGTDVSVNDVTTACNADHVMEVEVKHGEPSGKCY
eukprot:XP_011663766.1 PREDICTED: uncharacterized protein LOC105438097 [Strongylocentrotus purpuratus]